MNENDKSLLVNTLTDGSCAAPIERGEDQTLPAIGRWFWWTNNEKVEGRDGKKKAKMVRRLVCVTALGSNYAEITSVRGSVSEEDRSKSYRDSDTDSTGTTWRLHFDEWAHCTTREFDADAIIRAKVERGQQEVAKLLGEVKQLTARLFVSVDPRVESAKPDTGSALVTLQNAPDPKEYGKALVKAKEKTIPALFEKIKDEHTQMARWMRAQLIPMKAEAELLKPVMENIERRIFHVELYAGLTETIEQIRDGEPANVNEKVRLFQRRHYMDEECLLEYEAGGMDFKKIDDFDKWLAKPANMTRILPHPRSVIAFQVRRFAKDYDSEFAGDWRALVQFHIGGEAASRREANKWTYLYMRNGDQLFRLSTTIEFDEELFPDVKQSVLQAKEPLYATHSGDEIITESDYLQRKAQRAIYDEAGKKAEAAWKASKKDCPDCAKTRAESKQRYDKCAEHSSYSSSWFHFRTDLPNPSLTIFHKVSTAWAYFDDVMKALKKQADEFNRVVLVLQGVFDRSPTFNPHPVYQLYGPEFPKAVELIYDNARALAPGEKPDIEAYFAAKNAGLKPGDVTVGQQGAWHAAMAEAQNDRNRYSDRFQNDHGPGELARVLRVTGKGEDRKAHFAWTREPGYETQKRYRSLGMDAPDITCRLAVPVSDLFNVSAYKAGEYRRFFADPRTRGDYMKWAWALLKSEDFLGGKAEIQEPPAEVLTPRKGARDEDAAARRARRRELDTFHGKLVRLRHDITTTGQETGEKGLLCRAYRQRGKLRVTEVFVNNVSARKDEDGDVLAAAKKHTPNYSGFRCRGLDTYDMDLAGDVKDETPGDD